MSRLIKIITREGLVEVERDVEDKPRILVGRTINFKTADETEAIAHIFQEQGFEVLMTSGKRAEPWPQDLYVQNNGYVFPAGIHVPGSPSRDIGQGGNYIFGEGFVLISDRIKDLFWKHYRDNRHFREMFEGLDLVFLPPYSRRYRHCAWDENKGELIDTETPLQSTHLDLTVGYIPGKKLLTIADVHLAQIGEKALEKLVSEHGVKLHVTDLDMTGVYHPYPNNYQVVMVDGEPLVVATNYEGFSDQLREIGITGVSPEVDPEEMLQYGGSIRCATNLVYSLKMLDVLGIKHEKFEEGK